MKKIFWIIGISLVVLLIAVSLVIGLYLGPIVKIAIEQIGPKVTQVSVKVDHVDVSLLTGSAALKGLVVGNPSGYSVPQAISVGTVAISVDPFSVTSKKILVHSIHIQSPEITFEGSLSGSNLSKIGSNANGAPKESNASTNQVNNQPASKIEVDDLLITGAKVHVYLSSLVGTKTISLPDIHLTDMGKDSDGLTPADLTSEVLKAIISSTVKAVAGSVGDLSQGVESLGKGTISSVDQGVSKITSSISSLLGK